VVSTLCALEHAALNHRVAVVEGVLEEECRAEVQAFFRERRGEGRPEDFDDR
jgi:tRNA(adenine34) deaminase